MIIYFILLLKYFLFISDSINVGLVINIALDIIRPTETIERFLNI